MSCGAQGLIPNFNAWLQTAWGSGAEYWSSGPTGLFANASNLVFGQNPPYFLDDFLSFFPKFFGVPTSFMGGTTTLGGNQITALSSTVGIFIGQFLVSADFPKGTIVTAVTSSAVTVNNNAIANDNNATLQVYTNPVAPIAVIQLYLRLAYASLVFNRWQEEWCVAMGWFIAHYLTLYIRSDAQQVLTLVQASIHGEAPTGAKPGTIFNLSATPTNGVLQGLYKNGVFQTPGGVDYTLVGNVITMTNTVTVNDTLYANWPVNTTVTTPTTYTPAQIAAQGIANGIEVSKSVGDVSASYSVLESLKEFGQWNLTLYGQQLATMAKVIGSGPMVIW
jgi:hypothetical protein